MKIQDRLKTARKSLNLTQKSLAESIGLNPANIRDLESGKVKFSTLHILSLEHTFKINSLWLQTGQGKMFKEDAKEDISSTYPKINVTILEKLLTGIEICLKQMNEKLSSGRRAEIISLLYEMWTDKEVRDMGYETDIDIQTIKSFLKLWVAKDKEELLKNDELKNDIFLI